MDCDLSTEVNYLSNVSKIVVYVINSQNLNTKESVHYTHMHSVLQGVRWKRRNTSEYTGPAYKGSMTFM